MGGVRIGVGFLLAVHHQVAALEAYSGEVRPLNITKILHEDRDCQAVGLHFLVFRECPPNRYPFPPPVFHVKYQFLGLTK